eukprot:gi/632964095/ref/XP_007898233.1/ PREDICTED: actin-fragmin kinase-like [Callorhinchus milii]
MLGQEVKLRSCCLFMLVLKDSMPSLESRRQYIIYSEVENSTNTPSQSRGDRRAWLVTLLPTSSPQDQQPKYFNDFYMLTVTLSDLTWEAIPQNGCIPSHREGHSICVVKGKIFLFGGRWQLNAEECLPGMHCFDIESLTWEKLQLNGIAPCTLCHSATPVGDNIFVFGGIQNGAVSNDLFMFSTVSLTWTPVKTTGLTPAPRVRAKLDKWVSAHSSPACYQNNYQTTSVHRQQLADEK